MSDLELKISDLRTRITFQAPTIGRDAGSAQIVTYADVDPTPTVWCRWINSYGQEAVSSDALKSAQRATVTIRHRADVLPTWRVLKDGIAWQILSVDLVRDYNRWVVLIVERVKGTV